MISLFTTVERDHDVVVDYNGDERDPAWRAVCNTGYWAGVWHHADDYAEDSGYLPGIDPPEWAMTDVVWANARDTAERAALDEGLDHKANHTDD